jgi:hypothetical protein
MAEDELFAIWGSAGYLELAAFRASAAQILNAQPGQLIIVTSDEQEGFNSSLVTCHLSLLFVIFAASQH